ncbi:MAG: TIGR04282 family arsenosugar biosynthesis glycosyltransferase [Desulfobacterales bacterium]|jgi:rSAM/selenodomain-associated transferase 1
MTSTIPPTERLILFTRYPEPGSTKTRLIPVLGAAGAADLHRRMVERTAAIAARLADRRPVFLEVRFEGGSPDRMAEWLGPRWVCRPQAGGDIGARMRAALEAAFDGMVVRVVLIGSDIPGITPALLEEAFECLGDHDLVFGPAEDGGYYLLGARKDRFETLATALFSGIPWGTATVLHETLSALASSRASVRRLKTLRDIDRPEDLAAWKEAGR